ncbi:MAG TPA: SDR family NAD(P)-dependent oxidoreductase [Chloroflexi bacterium]|nr:SDR family NAD(P)-dependent oxidoreductase [Chloroflexota bacterium]
MKDLHDRVIIITGASGGIGAAAARAFARVGAHVALAARRPEALEVVAARVRALGREALTVPTDVTRRADVAALVARTREHFGRLDGVVANAGVYLRSPIRDLTPDLLERSLAVNFYGGVYLVLEALPHLLARGEGHIVLVTSMDGKKGLPPDAPYVAAKFALSGFGDVLRQELHGTGVGVSTVFPGRVDTPMIADLKVPWISAKIPPEAVAQAIVRAVQRNRAEVIVPFQARLLYWAQCFAPRLADWAVRAFRLQGWE